MPPLLPHLIPSPFSLPFLLFRLSVLNVVLCYRFPNKFVKIVKVLNVNSTQFGEGPVETVSN